MVCWLYCCFSSQASLRRGRDACEAHGTLAGTEHKLRTVQLLYLPECSKTYQGSGVENRGQPFSEHCSSGSREQEAQSCVPRYVFSSYGTIILPVSRTLLLTHHRLIRGGSWSHMCCILRSWSLLVPWNYISSSMGYCDIYLGRLYSIYWGHPFIKCIPKDNYYSLLPHYSWTLGPPNLKFCIRYWVEYYKKQQKCPIPSKNVLETPVPGGGFVWTHHVFDLIWLANKVTHLETYTQKRPTDLCPLKRVKFTGPKGKYICELASGMA